MKPSRAAIELARKLYDEIDSREAHDEYIETIARLIDGHVKGLVDALIDSKDEILNAHYSEGLTPGREEATDAALKPWTEPAR